MMISEENQIFRDLPLFEESTPIAPSPAEEDGAPSSGVKQQSFSWWPVDFFNADEADNAEDANAATDTAAAFNKEEDLARQLRDAYQVIERQHRKIGDLRDEIDNCEAALHTAEHTLRTTKKRHRMIWYGLLGFSGLTAIMLWHREISQVGWNIFHLAADVLNLAPEAIVGFLTSGALVWLFGQIVRWTYYAAMEDLLQEQEDDYDLHNR